MKKSIITLSAAVFAAGSILSGCSSPEKKVENAQENVQDAKQDVKDAKQELAASEHAAAVSDFQKFKMEANEQINNNDRRITELRIDMKSESKDARALDGKKIDALETRNHDLKVKLDGYNDDGKTDWQEFKKEFNHDMDGIGEAFKNITVRNTK